MDYAIRQAESGTPIGDLCRQLGVSEATFYTWKWQYVLSDEGATPVRPSEMRTHDKA
ncbi:MAG: transposase [Nitrospiraceae bacterium]|uniref:transposase n=1 Tax=Nitrospira cf. moscoviensis SBR1015 TaxID=96242 RepID=UPI000B3BB8F6|nr:transposase [Nitrospira cf. moscoviensis SBR1015]MBY0249176.1 transposase [Nitrospiraceae bacterium]